MISKRNDQLSDRSLKVSTFWHGPSLPALDTSCLMSFVAHGFDVTIYTYNPLRNIPSAITVADAADIVDQKYLFAFKVLGKPSIAHFSDIFRMNLFRKKNEPWIDCDLFCLRDFMIPLTGNFLAKETSSSVNGAILRLDAQDPRLNTMIDELEGYASGANIKWGATGPALIVRVFGAEALRTAFEPEVFYPIHWNDWFKPFLPRHDEWCQAHCKAANALHLWNNIVEKSGYCKTLAPPAGSFLHRQLHDLNLIGLFSDICPVSVMEHLVENYANSRTGENFTLRELAAITTRRTGQVIQKRLSGSP
jgi:hypothetical protein